MKKMCLNYVVFAENQGDDCREDNVVLAKEETCPSTGKVKVGV